MESQVSEAPVLGPVVYAKCRECDVVLWTPEIARRHVDETMTPVEQDPPADPNQPGIWVRKRAHGFVVVNPTPDEMAEYRIGSMVEDALQRFCDDLDTALQRGLVTEQQVTQFLRMTPDFEDAWMDWLAENGE